MTKLKAVILCAVTAVATSLFTLSITGIPHTQTVSSLAIAGPSQVSKGDLVEFKASVQNPSWFLNKTIYQWKVLSHDGEISFKNMSNSDILFPAGLQDNKFWVVCSAVNYHNYIFWGTVSPLDIRVNSVAVGSSPSPTPNPSPVPGPVVVPDGQYKIAIVAYSNWPKGQVDLAHTFGKNYKGIASAIQAGTIVTINDAQKKLREVNQASAGNAITTIQPWSDAVSKFVYTLYEDKKLTTMSDYATLLNEVGLGLSLVKE